jgi:hypothetical protein
MNLGCRLAAEVFFVDSRSGSRPALDNLGSRINRNSVVTWAARLIHCYQRPRGAAPL